LTVSQIASTAMLSHGGIGVCLSFGNGSRLRFKVGHRSCFAVGVFRFRIRNPGGSESRNAFVEQLGKTPRFSGEGF
jgi:hypothetical protein